MSFVRSEGDVDNEKVASGVVVLPTISSASFNTFVSLKAGTFSFTPLICSSGFGFDGKKPFKLF